MRRLFLCALVLAVYFLVFLFGTYFYIGRIGQKAILTAPAKAEAIVIPGASVLPGGVVSDVLRRRLDEGISLYNAGYAPKIIVTGDYTDPYYNEVGAMRDYLMMRGVPAGDILMDYEGFNTYKSIVRAKDVFKMRDVIIVTQHFQLVRALYIAERVGLKAKGAAASEAQSVYLNNRVRELGARVKAFFEAGVLPRAAP